MAEKNKGGRPRIELTDEKYEQLKAMVRIQCTADECSAVLEMSEDTIDRRLKERGYDGFADFFKRYGSEGKSSLRREQWKAAMAGNPTMLIWMGKQMLGQSDKAETTLRHKWEDMSDNELDAALEQRLAAAFQAGKDSPHRTH